MAGEGTEGDAPERSGRAQLFRGSSRYSAFVGLAFIGIIVVAVINASQSGDGTILGTEEIRGEPLPQFAVPDIRAGLDADANIAQDDCETSRNPCPADEQRVPACEIDPDGAIRVCDLFDRPLVLSFWFTRGADCVNDQDAFDEVARSYRGRVNFLSLNIRDERPSVERLVAEHGWTVPVGWDRDGAVSNIYRIGVCPTVAFAFPGGIFQSAVIGDEALEPGQLRDRVDELLAESRRREPGS
ncbi:MAG: hypothetical protein ABI726_02225 [bacterium]